MLAFFQANPEETLDAEAVAIKFGCKRAQVHSLLGSLVTSGQLRRKEDLKSAELIYSLGIPTAKPAQEAPAADRTTFWMDTTSIKIEKNVPIAQLSRSGVDWNQLLERMEIGDSFAAPLRAHSSLGSALTAFKKATGKEFSRRKVGGEFRVWRIK